MFFRNLLNLNGEIFYVFFSQNETNFGLIRVSFGDCSLHFPGRQKNGGWTLAKNKQPCAAETQSAAGESHVCPATPSSVSLSASFLDCIPPVQGINLSTGVAGGVRLGPRGCFAGMYHCLHLLYSRILSYLPGHRTRFLTPHGTGEIDCLNRLNVIQIRTAVQWHSFSLFSSLFTRHARKFSANCTVPYFFVDFCVFITAEVFSINFSHVFNQIFFFFQPLISL